MADLQTSSALSGVSLEGNDLASLLQKEFKPKSDEAKSAVEAAVQTLAQQALSQTKATPERLNAFCDARMFVASRRRFAGVCAYGRSQRCACSALPLSSR